MVVMVESKFVQAMLGMPKVMTTGPWLLLILFLALGKGL